MTMPDGNTAALRQQERAESRSVRVERRAMELAGEEADEMLADSMRLARFVFDYEPTIWRDLSFALFQITKAARYSVGSDTRALCELAALIALRRLRASLREEAIEASMEYALAAAREEER